jgi:outer membrane biosynthesis protein TonB
MQRSPIYGKTSLGNSALQGGRATLAPAARGLLILINGRRDLDELASVLGSETVQRWLPLLTSLGYVQAVQRSELPPATEPLRAPASGPAPGASPGPGPGANPSPAGPRPAPSAAPRLGDGAAKTSQPAPADPGAISRLHNSLLSAVRSLGPRRLGAGAAALGVVVAAICWYTYVAPDSAGITTAGDPKANALHAPPHIQMRASDPNAAPPTATPQPPAPEPVVPAPLPERQAKVAPPPKPRRPERSVPGRSHRPTAPSPTLPPPAGAPAEPMPSEAPVPPTGAVSEPDRSGALALAAPRPVPRGAPLPPSDAPLLAPAPPDPHLRTRVLPELSREARRAGIDHGQLVVRLHLSAAGTVDQVELVRADPPQLFDDGVQRTLAGWTFNPTGQPWEKLVELNFQR